MVKTIFISVHQRSSTAKEIKQVIEIPLTDAEQEKMEASASALKEVIETAFAKFEAEEAK